MTPLQGAVNNYHRQGFSVIPVSADSKVAAVKWETYQERRPTASELASWFSNGHQNVAVVCGSVSGGLAVLDIDDTALAAQLADDVPLRAETTLVRTPGGGLHIYAIETDAESRNDSFDVSGQHIGDLRANGGYVLVPPSSIKGREYSILANTSILSVPDASEWAVGLLKAYGAEVLERQHEPLNIAQAVDEMHEGNRNDSLFRILSKLRGKGLSKEELETFAYQTGRGSGLEDREIETILGSVLRFPAGEAPSAESEEMLANAPTQGIGGGGKLFKPVRADILATSEPENTSWSWEGYAPQGGVTLFCAPPKTGKTTIAYHLAGATSEGKPFLGQATTKSPVLVLAVEERRQDAANRVRALGLGENVYLHTGPLRADSIPTIAAFVVEKLIGLIIVDTLPRFWLLDNENDASAVNLAMAGIMALARDTNAALLLLYHLRKSPGGIDGEEIRGSGDIFSQVDIALIMRRRRDQSAQRTIKSFSRYDATPEEIVVALEDGEYVSLGDTEAVRDRETDAMLLEALSEVARTPEQIKEDADLKLAARTLFRHYERLFGTSRCAREGTGQKSLPYTYKMLATGGWQANPETASTDTNMLATTTDTLVVTDWQANSDEDNEGQRLYARSLWEGQCSPASVELGQGKTAADPEKLISTGNAADLAAFIAALEEIAGEQEEPMK